MRSPDISGDHGNRAGEGSMTRNTCVDGVVGHELLQNNVVDTSQVAGRDLEMHSSERDGTHALKQSLQSLCDIL